MTLVDVLISVLAVTATLLAATLLGVVGLDRIRSIRGDIRLRLLSIVPYIALLAGVLLVNSAIRDVGPEISWLIGIQITGTVYAIEGELVAWIQSFATPPATTYFSMVYIYGYIFLLSFPFVAYTLRDDLDDFRRLTIAYGLNYTIGLACYIVFVAYGPRNLMPELVDSLLYSYWPQSQLLTSQVNVNTNVFPSLHSSLSTTVAIFAIRSRKAYPRWVPIALPLAASVCLSTMYLGIHWGTDVVAGMCLAVVSVLGSDYLLAQIKRRAPSSQTVWSRIQSRVVAIWGR